MKRICIALSTVLLVMTASAFSQVREGDVVADVPFAFVVPGRTLPPGHYTVKRLNDLLSIADQQQSLFVPTHSVQRTAHEDTSKMVFHRYGDLYFLSEVWVGGSSTGKVLFPTRAERELADRGAERELAVVRMGK